MKFVKWILGFFLLFTVLLGPTGCRTIDLKFDRPTLIRATADHKKIVIYDSRKKRFLIADRNWNYIKEFTHPYFNEVWGFCISDKGEIVCTNNRHLKLTFSKEEQKANAIAEVLFFDFDGNLLRAKSWQGDSGLLIFPAEIIQVASNTYMITDLRNNHVVKMNEQGELIGKFGEYGDEPGKLYYPNDITLTPSGEIIIVDEYNSRLQLYDRDGNFVRVIVERGTEEGKVMFPISICCDSLNNIYVTEAYTMRVSMFDKNYNFVRCFYPPRQSEKINLPELICIEVIENPFELIVANSRHSSILVFNQDGTIKKTLTSLNYGALQ